MRKIFWIFTIRGRIHKAIKRTEEEKGYYDNQILKSPLSAIEAKYLSARISLKEEVIQQLKNLL
jgi:hypothetical protein